EHGLASTLQETSQMRLEFLRRRARDDLRFDVPQLHGCALRLCRHASCSRVHCAARPSERPHIDLEPTDREHLAVLESFDFNPGREPYSAQRLAAPRLVWVIRPREVNLHLHIDRPASIRRAQLACDREFREHAAIQDRGNPHPALHRVADHQPERPPACLSADRNCERAWLDPADDRCTVVGSPGPGPQQAPSIVVRHTPEQQHYVSSGSWPPPGDNVTVKGPETWLKSVTPNAVTAWRIWTSYSSPPWS